MNILLDKVKELPRYGLTLKNDMDQGGESYEYSDIDMFEFGEYLKREDVIKLIKKYKVLK